MIVIPETGLFDLVETFWSYKYVVVVLMSKCQKKTFVFIEGCI